jgi:hypothetical protein
MADAFLRPRKWLILALGMIVTGLLRAADYGFGGDYQQALISVLVGIVLAIAFYGIYRLSKPRSIKDFDEAFLEYLLAEAKEHKPEGR